MTRDNRKQNETLLSEVKDEADSNVQLTQAMFDQLQGKTQSEVSELSGVKESSLDISPVAPESISDKAESKAIYVQQNFSVTIEKGAYDAPPPTPTLPNSAPLPAPDKEPVSVNVTVKNHGIAYGFGRYCYKQLDDCLFIHLKSNAPLTGAINSLHQDFKLLYHGHASIDAMDWLGHQRMPIQSTLDAIDEGKHVARNFVQVRLVLAIILTCWIVTVVGYGFDIVSLFTMPISLMAVLDNLYKLAFTMFLSYVYYAYAYHGYAMSIDTFILKNEFDQKLRSFDFNAWFPFFKLH